MTNFVGCLDAFKQRGGRLSEDEGFYLPGRQFLKAPKKCDERIKNLLEGEYTDHESISTYRDFEYRARIRPNKVSPAIGMSTKRIKRQLSEALRDEKISATVSVKTGYDLRKKEEKRKEEEKKRRERALKNGNTSTLAIAKTDDETTNKEDKTVAPQNEKISAVSTIKKIEEMKIKNKQESKKQKLQEEEDKIIYVTITVK